MQANRLFDIIMILLNKGNVTAKELGENFNVSTRTIYRDIDALSLSGVPVYTNKGSGGGISLLPGYTLNKSLISEQEQREIMMALQSLKASKYPDIDNVVNKLGGLFKNNENFSWIEIDFSQWGNKKEEKDKFRNIKEAIVRKNAISFSYLNSYGSKSQRTIEPLKLIYKGQAWYLQGYCRNKKDYRTFKISRIKNLQRTEEKFNRNLPENLQIDAYPSEKLAVVKLRLRVEGQYSHRVFDEFDEECISINDDGSYNVEVTYPEGEWVYGYIMSFGSFAVVLEPEHIRVIIKDRLQKAIGKYN